MTQNNNEPVLTQAEEAVVRRFYLALEDIGVRSVLRSGALEYLPSGKVKAGMRYFNRALGDVLTTNSYTAQDAGVSFQIVVEMARSVGGFPEDVLPSKETVDRCVAAFWDGVRREADAGDTGSDDTVTDS
jgi:hypothetical protein